jgi:hypothetical protein
VTHAPGSVHVSELPAPEPPLPDEDPPVEIAHDAARRYPSTIGGLFYLVVLAGTGLGIWIAWSGDWRLGIKWVGAALILAGLVRLLLRQRDAGMLAVRKRWIDVAMLAGVGGALIFLSESIPNQPL